MRIATMLIGCALAGPAGAQQLDTDSLAKQMADASSCADIEGRSYSLAALPLGQRLIAYVPQKIFAAAAVAPGASPAL